MQEALRLVVAATKVHGKKRHNILVKAMKILTGLREPPANRLPFERLVFQRSGRLLRGTIGKLGENVAP